MNKNETTKKIDLFFDANTTRLTGYQTGIDEFSAQVAPYIDYSEDKIVLKLPEQIEKMSSSFVQGFFHKFIQNWGYMSIGTRIEVETDNKTLITFILDNLI